MTNTGKTYRGSAVQPDSVPKVAGADIEIGNFIIGIEDREDTCALASKALLSEISGVAGTSWSTHSWSTAGYGGRSAYDPQDWGRKFLPTNGGCCYIDLNHLELCIPEVISAYDHVACWHAMLRIARGALERANGGLPPGRKLVALVNNSDGQGHSYGSHMNFLVTRRCYREIFEKKLHHMLFLASHFVSSVVYTGAGKVGSENGRGKCRYQLGQRPDFFESITGSQTTFHRPIVNSRDESLCGSRSYSRAPRYPAMARLHVIYFDNTLCHVASLLKVGVTQIVLAMIERGHADASLMLEDPVRAAVRWSHDPSLRAKARLISGKSLTAVEMQSALLERAERFVDAGEVEGIVPEASRIMELWGDTLELLRKGDMDRLAPRLDWVLKKRLLEMSMQSRSLDWDSPEIKYLDHIYSSLDAAEGLYWNCEDSGAVQRVVSSDRIRHFVDEPPEDTRAWTRAMLLRRAGHLVSSVDWDSMRFRLRDRRSSWPTYRRLELGSPLDYTRTDTESVLARPDTSVKSILDALGATESESWSSSASLGSSGSGYRSSGGRGDSGGSTKYPVIDVSPKGFSENS